MILINGIPPINLYAEPNSYEVAVSMFDKCNLRCKFCYQDHKKAVDIEFIKTLDDKIISSITAEMRQYYGKIKVLSLLFMGGELFSDDISGSTLQAYKGMWVSLRSKLNTLYPNLKLQYSVSTNGVWENRDRIVKLLQESGIDYVNLSYDPVGRFPNDETREIMHETVKYLHNNGFGTTIGFVTTKKNIRAVLNDDKYARWLKSDYVTRGDLNMYIGNPGWEEDLPNDEDMFNFYKWCFDNELWKINFVRQLMENYIKRESGEFLPRYCDCKYEQCISQSYITKNCVRVYSPFPQERFFGNYTEKVTEENVADIKANLGAKKLGCLACEHMYYCIMPCWTSVIFDGYKPNACPIKSIFNYITDTHVSSFKNWEKNNGY